LAANPLTFLFFLIFHREAHHSTQSVRPFGPAQPTTPSFLSRPERLTPAQLAYRLAVSSLAAAALRYAPPCHVMTMAAVLHLSEVEPKRRVVPFKFAIKTPPPYLLFPLNSFETYEN
jgi:hypothetical protein